MNLPKKILVQLAIACLPLAGLLANPPLALAQENAIDCSQAPASARDFCAVAQSLQEFIQANLACDNGTDYSVFCFIPNAIKGSINTTIFLAIGNDTLASNGAGLLPALASTTTSLYRHPPAQTKVYLADLQKNLLGRPAYAQGYGYTALNPVLEIWKAFRNISYFFFVILFVALGFMIMFRTKINPQTVISIQNSLPRIVVTLILITFSYALVGFMIDLMYFLTGLVIQVFALHKLVDPTTAATMIFRQNIFVTFFKEIIPFRGDVELTKVFPFIENAQFTGIEGTLISNLPTAIAAILDGVFGSISQIQVLGTKPIIILSSFLGILIVVFALIFTVLRLFVTLLSSFVNIVLSVILAPLLLSANAIPGSNAFTNWFKNLLANILVFPGVALFLLLAGILVNSQNLGANPDSNIGYDFNQTQTPFVPPMIISQYNETNFAAEVQFLLGFGLILLSPSVAQMIKDSMKVEPFKYTKDIGAAVAAGTWPIRTLITQEQERRAMQKQDQMLRSILNPQQA